MKERCNDMERQNVLAKFPEKITDSLQRTEFFLGQEVIHRMLFEKRKEWNSVANSRNMASKRS